MEKDPHCRWCGVEVVYFELQKNQRTPDNFATIDHLKDRNNPTRREVGMKAITLVLACNKCNWERSETERKNTPIEVLRERSGNNRLKKL